MPEAPAAGPSCWAGPWPQGAGADRRGGHACDQCAYRHHHPALGGAGDWRPGLVCWSTTLFVVASIIGAALAVRMLARWGARGAMLAGLLVFGRAACCVQRRHRCRCCCWAAAVQGLGGGAVGALSYTLIRLVFPPALWPRAIG
ncbi:MFS transporter [Comamonas sp. JC664]|uniref:MFS transporter n=1 Tax=Comamonas sp. JC664 TaxID=2801917 RepID=UPI003607B87E